MKDTFYIVKIALGTVAAGEVDFNKMQKAIARCSLLAFVVAIAIAIFK